MRLIADAGAPPLIFEVIGVIEAWVAVAEAELEVEFEVAVIVAAFVPEFCVVELPPLSPLLLPVCDGLFDWDVETSETVAVDEVVGASRLYK